MNHLAHQLLAHPDPDLRVGHFLADGVKGRAWQRFPDGIANGIRAHRHVDFVTDHHPVNIALRATIRPLAGRWAGVALDVLYDHVLARDWTHWHDGDLHAFTRSTYDLLDGHRHHMPDRLGLYLDAMTRGDWLAAYARPDHAVRALQGMARRLPAAEGLNRGAEIIDRHGDAITEGFEVFFPELVEDHAAFLVGLDA